MSLVKHAKAELRAAGMFDPDSDYDGDIAVCVMALMETFTAYGHSGGSAEATLSAFDKLVRYQPLTPLTGAPDEWEARSKESGVPMWQNKRCSRIVKDNKRAWDVETNLTVTFPYEPPRRELV